MLPQFHCAAFAQACKVNFEEVRFAIAGVIFLRFVIDDRNNLHESFSSRDYFNNCPSLQSRTRSFFLSDAMSSFSFSTERDRRGTDP